MREESIDLSLQLGFFRFIGVLFVLRPMMNLVDLFGGGSLIYRCAFVLALSTMRPSGLGLGISSHSS